MGQVQANLDTTKEIRGLDIEIKGLANMLELRNFDKTPLDNEFNGYYDISRALITSGDLSIQNQLTSLPNPQDSFLSNIEGFQSPNILTNWVLV